MKRTMGFLFALGLVGALSAAGCGDNINHMPPGGGTEEITLDDLPTKLAEAVCENLYSCCTATELIDFFADSPFNPPPKTQAECNTAAKMGFDFSEQKNAIDAGRMKLDSTQATTCLSKVQESCPLNLDDPACETVFIGLVVDGSDCASSDECAMAGSRCIGAIDMMLGRCQPLPKEGEPCANSGCAEDLVCDSASMCIQPRLDGQMCVGDGECLSLYCDLNVCTPKKTNGEACSPSDFQCKDGYCDELTQVCTPRKATGMPCKGGDECLGACHAGTSTCTNGPPACDGL